MIRMQQCQFMNILTLTYRTTTAQLSLENCQSPVHLARVLQTTFNTREDILGITDPFGKFYDLQYASNHLCTLHNHKFRVVTTRDAINNVSFGSKKSTSSDQALVQQKKCLGWVSDIITFRKTKTAGLVVIITIAEGESVSSVPFEYYLAHGQGKWFQVWSDGSLLLECEIGPSWQKFIFAAAQYLSKQRSANNNDKGPPVLDLSCKQGMILQALDELLQDGILSDKAYAKKKSLLFERPEVYVKRYFTGQTIDRSELVNVIRTEIINKREGKGQSPRHQSDKPLTNSQSSGKKNRFEQNRNLFQEMQKEGLISKYEKQFYLRKLTNQDDNLFKMTRTYWKGEQDEIQLALKLKQAFAKAEKRSS